MAELFFARLECLYCYGDRVITSFCGFSSSEIYVVVKFFV